jgi:hypothetical protein
LSEQGDTEEESMESERKLLEASAQQELRNYIKILKEARQKLESEEK